ncbi:MAG: amidophosphoribosyltransferase [Bacteroidales bacterium 43_36]|nr:MAG: amidophosphoribosyltransferase [Bacteroidales bacterium 43_36]
MEQLKHECGVAMIRLRKPLRFYKEKYGTYSYALNLLYLMMEKQHNRGQEAAGVGVVKIDTAPGNEYIFRERALGTNAITEIFATIGNQLEQCHIAEMAEDDIAQDAPFIGNVYMGHLRYSTTGKSGISFVHPFLRRNNWRSRNLLLCGNFNLTNVDLLFDKIVGQGQHPRIYSDTFLLLEQLGCALDHECHRIYRTLRDNTPAEKIEAEIERLLDPANILKPTAPDWDGGFVICGATGSGDMFALRDAHGIRPAFYYADDEIIVVASERPVIQTVLNVRYSDVKSLAPGNALIVGQSGEFEVKEILPAAEYKHCSFERIYFSRGSDRDIYTERKQLGRNLVPKLMKAINHDLANTVFSFIPNTAEVAFLGLVEGLTGQLDAKKCAKITELQKNNELTPQLLTEIMAEKLRIEKVAIKDIKLRTFIAEGSARNDLAAHVYDVTYGCIKNDKDTLVVIDDSIVRGTTLRQSIIKMLDRLHPRRIIVLSSSPQVRYPDYYGIDMSRMNEFIAFRAAIALLKEHNKEHIIKDVYDKCVAELLKPVAEQANCVKAIYQQFSTDEISKKIAEILTPADTNALVEIIYPEIETTRNTLKSAPGDWYFSGEYPTPGGNRLVNRAFINYYEGNYNLR